jgi:hypothetical protein
MPAGSQQQRSFGERYESAADLESGVPSVFVADHGVLPRVARLVARQVEVDTDVRVAGVVVALPDTEDAGELELTRDADFFDSHRLAGDCATHASACCTSEPIARTPSSQSSPNERATARRTRLQATKSGH